MGLFGFGKKKRHVDEADPHADESGQDDAVSPKNEGKGSVEGHVRESEDSQERRGQDRGPWDVNDENVPDYDEYLDIGAYYLPFLKGIELRIKADRATRQVLGSTITYGSSSLEIEAFAAPKTMGLWEDMRTDLVRANDQASEVEGTFGIEVRLPVSVKGGKRVTTRIVGVDGPRWMLRGIFSGKAATEDCEERTALEGFFADIVVERGEEPLAPRDLIPMHPPVSPEQRRKDREDETAQDGKVSVPGRPDGPLDSDQQVEVKTTLSRGPMFSEVR